MLIRRIGGKRNRQDFAKHIVLYLTVNITEKEKEPKMSEEKKSIIASAVAHMKRVTPPEEIAATLRDSIAKDVTKKEGYPDEQKYKDMGLYEPYKILKAVLTPEEFRGWVKGDALVYLLREKDKGQDKDIVKAMRMLQFLQ